MGGCADPKEVIEDLSASQPNAGMGAALDQMSNMEMCLCDTPLCNTASKKSDALQCYQGMCAPGSSGVSPCSDDHTPSLHKITCPEGHTMCMKMTGLVSGYNETKMRFGCAKPAAALLLGIKDGGCADPKEVIEDLSASQPNAGMGAALDQMSNMEVCLCDTPLCNTASKKSDALQC